MLQPKNIFYAILFIYLALSAGYAVFTPPWESPDEVAHYLYAAQLAERWRPAPPSEIQQVDSFYKDQPYLTSSYEWFQPAIGYLPAALAYKAAAVFYPKGVLTQLPALSALSPEIPARYNVFIHPEKSIWQTWRANRTLLAMRLVSALSGLVVIAAAFSVGKRLSPQSDWLGLAGAGVIAFLPQFTFINASVRGDTLTNALAALVFWLSARVQFSEKPSSKDIFFLGALLGLGLLGKNTFLYMVPIGFLALFLSAPRFGVNEWKNFFKLALFILLPWLAYYLAFDEARQAFAHTTSMMLKINPDYLNWAYLKTIPGPLLIDLFYARFGWANLSLPWPLTGAIFGLWCLGSGLSLTLFLSLAAKTWREPAVKILLLLLAGEVLALMGALRFNLSIYQPQGRFLFPALLPWAFLGLWGVWQKIPALKQKHAAFWAMGGMLVFNLYALLGVLFPAYWG